MNPSVGTLFNMTGSEVQVNRSELWVANEETIVGELGRTPTGTINGSEYSLSETSFFDLSLIV